jgi:hypothetical protein
MGTPQGSVLSPLLSNIVLNELDVHMDKIKQKFEKGTKRSRNPEYDKLTSRLQYLQKHHPGSPEILKVVMLRRATPSLNTHDPNFKRLLYLRYADDFVALITGTSDEANLIKHQIADILMKKCGLELNKEKTLVTAIKDGFNFLGAKCIKVSPNKAGLSTNKAGNPSKYRMRMRIEIPVDELLKRLLDNKFIKLNDSGEPISTARKDLVNFEHHEIVTFYNHRIQGLFNFYSFAANLNSLRSIFSMLQLSCALTMALKYKLRTKRSVFKRFGHHLQDPETGLALKIPKNLKVKHKYSGVDSKKPEDVVKIS